MIEILTAMIDNNNRKKRTRTVIILREDMVDYLTVLTKPFSVELWYKERCLDKSFFHDSDAKLNNLLKDIKQKTEESGEHNIIPYKITNHKLERRSNHYYGGKQNHRGILQSIAAAFKK